MSKSEVLRANMQKVFDTDSYQEFVKDIFIELIDTCTVTRTEEQMNDVCAKIYDEVSRAEEKTSDRSKLN